MEEDQTRRGSSDATVTGGPKDRSDAVGTRPVAVRDRRLADPSSCTLIQDELALFLRNAELPLDLSHVVRTEPEERKHADDHEKRNDRDAYD